MSSHPVELLLPAGSADKVAVALAYGADAVYVGAAGFSMRPNSSALTPEQLSEAVATAHAKNAKLFVCVNSLLFDSDIAQLHSWLAATREIPMDAIIVSDPGAFDIVRSTREDVELHISTQASIANTGSAKFWERAGADRVILARECSLDQTRLICDAVKIPVEVFMHGAMCTAVSGRCLLSAHVTGFSASRGECKHSCRWEYQLVESKRPGETQPVFETGRETVFFGSTDLCMLTKLPQLLDAGVASLKVEGRMKNEHYLAVVGKVYREAVDAYLASPATWDVLPKWLTALDTVAHQPYSLGYADSYPVDEPSRLQSTGRVYGTHEIAATIVENTSEAVIIDVKNRILLNDELEWLSPTGDGTVAVLGLETLRGNECEAVHPGTRVVIKLSAELPADAMLRQRIVR